MHRDAGPTNWTLICISFQCDGPASRCVYSGPKRPADNQTDRHKIKNSHIQLGEWTDIHIILTLKGFEPVAYGCMRCVQLRAA